MRGKPECNTSLKGMALFRQPAQRPSSLGPQAISCDINGHSAEGHSSTPPLASANQIRSTAQIQDRNTQDRDRSGVGNVSFSSVICCLR